MLPYSFHKSQLFSPAAIKSYRQNGFVLVNDFLRPEVGAALSAACRTAVCSRGADVFPAMDRQFQQFSQLGEKAAPASRPGTRATLATTAPREMSRQEKKIARQRKMVDRLYKRLMARNNKQRGELSAAPSHRQHLAPLPPGLSEQHMRHIDDMKEFTQNWGKNWCQLWPQYTALREVLLGRDGVGAALGVAAAALSGEVVVRLFMDTVTESFPFLNATPIMAPFVSTNVRSTTALTALLGLDDLDGRDHSGAAGTVLLPGSHRVLQALTQGGREPERLYVGGVFDIGRAIRHLPEVQQLPVVKLPPLQPGSALFYNNFLLVGSAPTLAGCAGGPYIPPPARAPRNPCLYSLTLIPDRCAFDGKRNSWFSRDSHGPLYHYQEGDLLSDDAAFPVLHRALDIE